MNHTTTKPTGAIDPKHVPPANDSIAEDRDRRPTVKQLAYLRALANRAGQTFTYPRTARHASAEIRRLQTQKRSTRVERAIERKQIADQIARGPADAARVDVDRETTGYGSTATWR